MYPNEFYEVLKNHSPVTLTHKQDQALQQLSEFLLASTSSNIFLLKGYAGTGKTTLTGILVNHLNIVGLKSVLLAPTGRAAKVMSNLSGRQAQTIHKHIYYPQKKSDGSISFQLKNNKQTNTLFIIDEASMISDTPGDQKLFENGSLLDDLLMYVTSGKNCKVLFIGDTAQLPPVKSEVSPALDVDKLSFGLHQDIMHIELNEVVRQAKESGVLMNATVLRKVLNDGFYDSFSFEVSSYKDVIRITNGSELIDAIQDAYAHSGYQDSVIILKANKRANIYNQQIRSRILFREQALDVDDYLMVVKNNYYWIDPTSETGFIANGDVIKVNHIYKIEKRYGFRFASVEVSMVDYPNQKPFDTILLLETLNSETPSLLYEDSNRLYHEILKEFANEKSKYKKFLGVKNHKYFNALQVKFSYAITCHKSQGGQWDYVFVEQPYIPEELTKNDLRWLYTAITRTRKKLYLIGFKDDFF